MGLLEPINTRITDPQYFLDTPQQGRNLVLLPSSPLWSTQPKASWLSPLLSP